MTKLKAVLKVSKNLFVVARTDATDPDDALNRVRLFAAAGADAVLVDGLKDLNTLPRIKEAANGLPVCFNQLAGGKSPNASLAKLSELGVSMVNYSTPCLFAAQASINQTLNQLKKEGGNLENLTHSSSNLKSCKGLLDENYAWRKARFSGYVLVCLRACSWSNVCAKQTRRKIRFYYICPPAARERESE